MLKSTFSSIALIAFVVLAAPSLCNAQNATVLDPEEFKDLIDQNMLDVICDVRQLEEWESGHIEGATFCERLNAFGTGAQVATPDDLAGCEYCSIAVYCRAGTGCSGDAIQHLVDAGFVGQVYNAQGVNQWVGAGFPLVNTTSVDPPCTMDANVSEQCLLESGINMTETNNTMPTASPILVLAPVPPMTPLPTASPSVMPVNATVTMEPTVSPTSTETAQPVTTAPVTSPPVATETPTTSPTNGTTTDSPTENPMMNETTAPSMPPASEETDPPTVSPVSTPTNATDAPSTTPMTLSPTTTNETDSECAALNLACSLTGDCCPQPDGIFLDCCANKPADFGTCQANINCAAEGLTGACCPTVARPELGLDSVVLDCCIYVPSDCGDRNCTYSTQQYIADIGQSSAAHVASLVGTLATATIYFAF